VVTVKITMAGAPGATVAVIVLRVKNGPLFASGHNPRVERDGAGEPVSAVDSDHGCRRAVGK